MVASFVSKVFRGSDSSIEADLHRATESGGIEIPAEHVQAVVQWTYTEEERRIVMRHIRECLAEPSGKRWRRTYAGLVLLEQLAKKGSPELLSETAEGRHFDLVQRLSLLEHFEFTSDKRVQNCVRAKAKSLRADMVTRLQAAEDGAACSSAGPTDAKDTASTCSPGVASAFSSSPSSTGCVVLNGVVAVGHRDDTTSESSCDDRPRRAVEIRQPRRQQRRSRAERANGARRPLEADTDSDDGPKGAPPQPPPPRPAPQMADLLEL
mmetsp:Transcript_105467/g.264070  ORF Transcript_105467/g.264070 Transcript_105467/m.264070 type:complete len:266 (+) Transcript_105467:90-887(+)